jgi:hypothetical protein
MGGGVHGTFIAMLRALARACSFREVVVLARRVSPVVLPGCAAARVLLLFVPCCMSGRRPVCGRFCPLQAWYIEPRCRPARARALAWPRMRGRVRARAHGKALRGVLSCGAWLPYCAAESWCCPFHASSTVVFVAYITRALSRPRGDVIISVPRAPRAAD